MSNTWLEQHKDETFYNLMGKVCYQLDNNIKEISFGYYVTIQYGGTEYWTPFSQYHTTEEYEALARDITADIISMAEKREEIK